MLISSPHSNTRQSRHTLARYAAKTRGMQHTPTMNTQQCNVRFQWVAPGMGKLTARGKSYADATLCCLWGPASEAEASAKTSRCLLLASGLLLRCLCDSCLLLCGLSLRRLSLHKHSFPSFLANLCTLRFDDLQLGSSRYEVSLDARHIRHFVGPQTQYNQFAAVHG